MKYEVVEEFTGVDLDTGEEDANKYEVCGSIIVSGPYGNVDWIEIDSVRIFTEGEWRYVENINNIQREEANHCLEVSGRKMHLENYKRSEHYEDERDHYDDDSGYSSGPDYWTDSESGEWRCG